MGNQAEELRSRIETLGARVLRVGSLSGWVLIWLEKEKLLTVAQELFSGVERLSVLEWITCFEVDGSLAVSYFLTDQEGVSRVCLRVVHSLPSAEERVACDSVSGIWPQASPYERELAELFGISFGAQETKERLPLALKGFPLRKAFTAPPLRGRTDA